MPVETKIILLRRSGEDGAFFKFKSQISVSQQPPQ